MDVIISCHRAWYEKHARDWRWLEVRRLNSNDEVVLTDVKRKAVYGNNDRSGRPAMYHQKPQLEAPVLVVAPMLYFDLHA